jgi:hypothetical protein
MKKKIVVNNIMQKGYTYELTKPVGKEFDIEFKPELTPIEMLRLGIFGGIYMRDCRDEYPKEWFFDAKFANGKKREEELNFFKVNASQSLKIWRDNGWINEEHDPRGWFEWYCRYYMGRRIEGYDKWQIKRWNKIKRHVSQIKKFCKKGDFSCRPRQRQAVLHWAYDSRKI